PHLEERYEPVPLERRTDLGRLVRDHAQPEPRVTERLRALQDVGVQGARRIVPVAGREVLERAEVGVRTDEPVGEATAERTVLCGPARRVRLVELLVGEPPTPLTERAAPRLRVDPVVVQ